MGISLNGLTPAGTYPGLIKTGDNTAISGTPKVLSDGNGNNLPMEVSTTGVNFTNNLTQGGTALQPVLVSGTNIKTINGTSVLGSGNIVTPSTNPSGVAGAIQFSDGSAFASDAANFFWDDTNNRLGIGTNAPTQILDLVRPAGQIGAIRFFNASNSENRIQSGSTFRIFNSTGGTPAASVGFFQNVNNQIGINTNNPTASLNVQGSGSTSATTSLLVQNSVGDNIFRVFDDRSVAITASSYGFNADNFFQLRASSNTLLIQTSNARYFGSSFIFGNATPNASAHVQMDSTTQGFLPPRMTTTQKNAIASPAAGLVVYDSTTNKLCCYNGSTWNDLF
jgi:hypothetical protein